MSFYYLMAQLPSPDALNADTAPPITWEAFEEICGRFLSEKAMETLRGLSLTPPREERPTGSALVDGWNRGEKALRLALGSVRSGSVRKSFDTLGESLQAPLVQTARTAVELGDPLQAEKFLYQHRLAFLQSLRPLDEFSEDAVYYYGLKLKLVERMRLFDEQRGRQAYRNIYDSILRGASQENVQ